jgi:hypothetical protein
VPLYQVKWWPLTLPPDLLLGVPGEQAVAFNDVALERVLEELAVRDRAVVGPLGSTDRHGTRPRLRYCTRTRRRLALCELSTRMQQLLVARQLPLYVRFEPGRVPYALKKSAMNRPVTCGS